MHPDEHALISDVLLAEALERARDGEDELAASWSRDTARARHERHARRRPAERARHA